MAGMSVVDNLRALQTQIASTAKQFGRDEGDVKLVAVSKTKPLSMIDEAVRAGQKIFGENYVQEAVEKIGQRPNLEWHFIGSLQTNKVKDIVGQVDLIHSVDRTKLEREISKEAQKKSIIQDVLLQLHVGDEATKHGFSADELLKDISEIHSLPGLRLRGLMSLPPLSEDIEVSRSYFREVKQMQQKLLSLLPKSVAQTFSILSMGTTSDFSAAIAEGATHVRVGTAIFGERERKL